MAGDDVDVRFSMTLYYRTTKGEVDVQRPALVLESPWNGTPTQDHLPLTTWEDVFKAMQAQTAPPAFLPSYWPKDPKAGLARLTHALELMVATAEGKAVLTTEAPKPGEQHLAAAQFVLGSFVLDLHKRVPEKEAKTLSETHKAMIHGLLKK